MQHATMVGYSSSEFHKHSIPENYKAAIYPSQKFAMKIQEQVLFACI